MTSKPIFKHNLWLSISLCLTIVVAGFSFSAFASTHADFTYEDVTELLKKFEQDSKTEHYARWFVPNETYPQDARPYYAKASKGWHIALGSERGFIGFAVNANATGLALADMDAGVLLFNRMNVALLRLAKDREHFLAIRKNARLWSHAISLSAELTAEDRELLNRIDVQRWWMENVQSDETFSYLTDPRNISSDESKWFGGVNYLKDDILFQRLQQAALRKAILVKKLNLNDLKEVESFLKALSAKDKITLLDISNAWQSNYVSNPSKHFLFSLLKTLGSSQTLFVGTTAAPGVRKNVVGMRSQWTYFAIPLSKVHEQAWFTEGRALDSQSQGTYIQALEKSCDSLLAS